jgi:ATP-dependent RNA helicase MSS116
MSGSPSILVATPGRLKDYLSEPATAAKLENIRTLILDEADTMLESGFLPDVTAILKLLPPKSHGWQGMCFSATIPAKIHSVINCVLKPGFTSISTVSSDEAPTVSTLPQYHVIIPSAISTFTTLLALLNLETDASSKVVIFGVTANMVALYAALFRQGLTKMTVFELHSRLNQNTRTKTTDAFKAATSGLMFASDVIGRGMDFPNVDLVVQVGLPSNGEQYVHRVGRTARAGAGGGAIIILTQAESFFLRANRHLPIEPHNQTQKILTDATDCVAIVEQAMYQIDETVKRKAYSSFIGFFAGSGFLKPLRLDKPGLVQMANDFAIQGMYCPEPPAMEKKTIGKMGLKGVPGFRYANANDHEAGDWGYAHKRPTHGGRTAVDAGVKKRRGDSHGLEPRGSSRGGRSRGGKPGRGRGGGGQNGKANANDTS